MKIILSKSFYNGETIEIAQALLGTCLVNETEQGFVAGRIVETEAYLCKDDPACHASRGKTPRNAVMFGPPGHAYVYLIYGMYHCFNVVTAPEGVGEAVLVRAVEPLKGLPIMERRRNTNVVKNLCSGPGKLVLAMGISPEHNGCALTKGALTIHSRESFGGCGKFEIEVSTRIGIRVAADLPLRFCVKGSPFVSR